ncbi:MAG: 3-isopropylmalate dehydratase small subunit [Acidimicrobiia bacterium]|nr:3-isopropylmalate dehydratase small subunit [Acidimicrobiia bacterium]
MKPVKLIRGSMAPLRRANVDTDQIMPKQFLKRVERTGYGEFLFWDWRRTADGRPDPAFVTNRPEYQQAKVLVTGPNFGSGSSREHAPWGIQDWGFEAVIAPSFADIFRTNCTKVGLLPVELSEKEVEYLLELAEHEPAAEIEISLEDQTVVATGFEASFSLDAFTRHRLLNGLDDIGLTLGHLAEIKAFEASRPAFKPAFGA